MNVDRMLGGLLDGRSGVGTGLLGGLAGRALLGRRGMRLGGLALLGGLAWMAYNKFIAKKDGAILAPEASSTTTVVTGSPDAPRVAGEITPPPEGSPFFPAADDGARDELGLLLVRAMIAAAKADGELDFEESTHIFGKISDLGLDDAERAFIESELRSPLDVASIVEAAKTPEARTEVYTASMLVTSSINDAEREYLEELADRLELDEALVHEIEATVGAGS